MDSDRHKLLLHLEKYEIENIFDFARENQLDHEKLIGSLKSLTGKSLIKMERVEDRIEVQLTMEGEEIVTHQKNCDIQLQKKFWDFHQKLKNQLPCS